MEIEPAQFKKFLVDAGVLSAAQFDKCLEKAKKAEKKLSEVLAQEGMLAPEKISQFEAYLLGVPFVNIEKEAVSPEVLKIIPEAIARAHNIIAFRKDGDKLEVAMLDPEDLRTIDFIKKTDPSLKIQPMLTTQRGIKNALMQYQKTLETEFGEIIKKEAQGVSSDPKELKKAAEELPIIRIIDTLLKHAILQRASDVHIEPQEDQVVVRYRVDGILKDAMALPKATAPGVVARIKVLSNLKLDEHRLPQDGRFKIETEDYKYSVRVSVLPVFGGEKIVMRLLAETNQEYTLEGLGLRGEALEKVDRALQKPTGMILVTGPTGSGKTTTLYAAMGILNTPDVNISTIEDPIEYRMPRVSQTQVSPKIGLTFASGLRSLVRQDPDIIMVGEIRDNETVGLAINAALTGHLVLSTLHTIDAAGAMPRLIDMRAEPFLISSTLNIIVAQRLVRKLIAKDEKYSLSESELKNLQKYCDLERILEILKKEKLVKAGQELKDVVFYRPKPSKDDEDGGFSGRLGIYEVLEVSDAIKQLIVKKATSDQIREQAIKEGMRTMVEDGFVKAALGQTTIEEVLRVIME